jgi:archaellin
MEERAQVPIEFLGIAIAVILIASIAAYMMKSTANTLNQTASDQAKPTN